MNKELFDSLDADLQKTVLECGAKAAENQRKLQREGVQQVIDKWVAAGVTVTELSEEAAAGFKAATESMYTDPEIVELLTADLIAEFTK
jgi:C4-dicarboxylate transporter DctM subunit